MRSAEIRERFLKFFADHGHTIIPSASVVPENDSNQDRMYSLSEMDADHVTAWSKGGATDKSNCQMLCKTHNRAKGNK